MRTTIYCSVQSEAVTTPSSIAAHRSPLRGVAILVSMSGKGAFRSAAQASRLSSWLVYLYCPTLMGVWGRGGGGVWEKGLNMLGKGEGLW